MADFPAGLKPSVTQGYSLGGPENVLSQNVQGGPPLMMLDYATGPTPFNIGLVLTAPELQTFQEFYVNDINNGALPFDINLDAGLGITSHRVVIDSNSLNIDGARAPIWVVSFSVIASAAPLKIGFDAGNTTTNSAISDNNSRLTGGISSTWKRSMAAAPLTRNTYWEMETLAAGHTNYGAVHYSFDVNGPDNMGSQIGAPSVSLTWITSTVAQTPDGNFTFMPGIAENGSTMRFKYEHATRTISAAYEGGVWIDLYAIPNSDDWYAAASVFAVNEQVVFRSSLSLLDYPVPPGYSTYDNDYTAP